MSFAVAWFAFVCVHAGTVFCYYGAPYLFVNAMLVQLTYLQASARTVRLCCRWGRRWWVAMLRMALTSWINHYWHEFSAWFGPAVVL